ncbi:hypothetical protein ACWELQ_43285, partial [Nocardia sp. NPDC004722]
MDVDRAGLVHDYGSLPTQPLPIQRAHRTRTAADPKSAGGPGRSESGGLARASRALAVAGAVSRVTGFARTIAVAAVLGTAAVGDAYNGVNNLPNMIYELLLGSVLA